MLHRCRHLMTPISYLRLRSPDLWVYKWVLPVIISSIAILGFYALPVEPPLFTEKGLVNTVNSLLNTLIGFYIAALAAVASFPNKSLDEPMRGRAPTIANYRQGNFFEEKLTRRRFLVILFGYCSFISIILFATGVISIMVSPSFGQCSVAPLLKVIWLAIYLTMGSSLFIATLLGLHYLIDRMHRD